MMGLGGGGLQFKVTDASVARRSSVPLSVSSGSPLSHYHPRSITIIIIVPTFRWHEQAKKRESGDSGGGVAHAIGSARGYRPASTLS
jgi:hypothetical protein